ncbi:hypothetical protein DPMN_173437 [Dreissena polymorpha]|uniref:Uncharacterized protein n=1 Tax=Dreissena polymorpha TaxID=45954 RepID=A0A9D4IGY0_DREPO|nr:hypothetical protein DPMN_173437 [Dreissena polymorpha]
MKLHKFLLQLPRNHALSSPENVFNRILQNRMKDVVDPHLRYQRNTDHIATLRTIMEQSRELNSSPLSNMTARRRSTALIGSPAGDF